jgi:streptogramin lyase
VRALVEAQDGRLWLAIAGEGLLRYDPATGRGEPVREEAGVDATLPDESIGSLLIDRSGMLWVGGQFRGISITDPRGSRFRYVFDLDSGRNRNPAADDSVRAAIQDDQGALWLGTDNGRLLRYQLEQDRFEDASASLAMPPQHRVVGFTPAGDGQLWVATSNGLIRYDPRTRRSDKVDLGEYRDATLRTITQDRDGALWLGTNNLGALRYDPRNGHVQRYAYREGQPSGLSHPTVHAIAQDRRGRIWMGTSDGLDLLDPATGQLRHFRHRSDVANSLAGNRVRAVHIASDGAIWIGTHAGLSRVIEVPGEQIHFAHPLSEALRGRPVPVVFSIAEAPSGRLWLGTDAGVLRFDSDTDQARAYGLADGLQDLEFNGGAVAYLSDGRVVLGGVRGINLFDPRRMADSRYTPPVRLLSARVGADDAFDAGVLWDPTRLDVPDGSDLLRLRIGAARFRAHRQHPLPLPHGRVRPGLGRQWRATGHLLHRAAAGPLHAPRAGDQPRWRVEPAGAADPGIRRTAAVAPPAGAHGRGTDPAGIGRDLQLALAPATRARARLLRADPRTRGTPETRTVGIGRTVLGLRPRPRRTSPHARRRCERPGPRHWRADLHRGRARDTPRRPAARARIAAPAPARRRGAVPFRTPHPQCRHGWLELGARRAAEWSSATAPAGPSAWPVLPATSPPVAAPSASVASPAKCCAAWRKRYAWSTATSCSCRSTPPSPA